MARFFDRFSRKTGSDRANHVASILVWGGNKYAKIVRLFD